MSKMLGNVSAELLLTLCGEKGYMRICVGQGICEFTSYSG